MKTISRAPYVLSVCAAAAMLAGCGGSRQLPNPAAQTPLGNAGTHQMTSSNENLTGAATLGRCREHYIHQGNIILGEAYRTDFHAHGKAAGTYSGTFTASGHWGFSYEFIQSGVLEFWDLAEKFTITSGASTVSGTIRGAGAGGGSAPFPTCTSFGPVTYNLQYASNFGDGNADTQIIKQGDFGETLDGL
jgi:hypothetical protein